MPNPPTLKSIDPVPAPVPNRIAIQTMKRPTHSSRLPAALTLPLAVLASALVGTLPSAAASYSESVSGDLPGNHLAPHDLGTLSVGVNTISGNSISLDRDYITFDIPSGMTLTSLKLSQYLSANNTAFLGITASSTMIDPNTAGSNIPSLLGYTHFGTGGPAGTALVGTDILDELGSGAGSAGFSPPLTSGDYTLWIQQASGVATQYGFELTVVPEPAESVLVAGACLGGACLLRHRLGLRRSFPTRQLLSR